MASVVTTVQPRTVKSVRYYRPELDMLRLLAVVMVYQFHLLPWHLGTSAFAKIAYAVHLGGPSGVSLFFMLSAFLISELLLREIETTGTVHIKSFYLRRILRIWPLFFFFILLIAIAAHINTKLDGSRPTLLAFSLMVGNWYVIFHGWPVGFIGPLWSISVEEQFYLMWPTIAKFTGRAGILVFSILFWCLAFIALPVFCAMKSTFTLGELALRLNSLVQFQFFAIGGLLALCLHNRRLNFSKYIRILLFIGGIAAITASNYVFHLLDPKTSVIEVVRASQVVPAYLCVDAGCVLLFLSFFGMTPPKWCNPLIYLGKISFGLYIFHVFAAWLIEGLIDRLHPHLNHRPLLVFVFAVPLTVAMAALSYRFLESPFLRLKNRFTFVRSREI
jgi:peptidoglycan/LPS O-acetylase OafA/YrhL